MKFVIDGTEYESANLGRLSLWDVKELRRQTGLTVSDIEQAGELLAAFGDDELAMLSDERAVDALGAIIWLARFTSGDRVTFEESLQVPIADIGFVGDEVDADAGEAPDPTAPALPDSAAADGEDDEAVAAAV